ncbi:MAG TPA: hypothetical protein VMS62_08960 [Gemmatimonadales bacterium]|jgi:hypothetical protein|nr:hypothetical protein [Gemmatimonadales bacterium]
MSRRSFSLIAAASLVISALTTACGRSDATGPSDIPQAMLESQGSNNLESQGSNN